MANAAYDLDELLARLRELSDERYREFNEGLTPGIEQTSLGVRMPALRQLSRELLKGDWRAFLEVSRVHALFELRMLHAMVLGGARCPVEEKIALTDAFLPWVDNWGVCDALCSSYKPKASELEPLLPFVVACADDGATFRKRFGLVMLMSYYREDPRALAPYRRFEHPDYYARMGEAWGLATLFLYQREGVLGILSDNVLDVFTHNKTIQKLRESYRVSDADKQMLLQYKRKRSEG